MSASVAASVTASWRGRPPGSWRDEEAVKERLRAHRRHLADARPTIVVEYRAPLLRRPLVLAGLPHLKKKKRRRAARQQRQQRAGGDGARQRRPAARPTDGARRTFVPMLVPIDESALSASRDAAALAAAVEPEPEPEPEPVPEPASPVRHYGPAPPAYRPSEDLVAAIVQFRTEELVEGVKALKAKKAALKAERSVEAASVQFAAALAVAQAPTLDASTEVCMTMVTGLQDGFRSTMSQLLDMQRKFVASRAASARAAQPKRDPGPTTDAPPMAAAAAATTSAATAAAASTTRQPPRQARMRRLLKLRREGAAKRKKQHLQAVARKKALLEQKRQEPKPEWDGAVTDLAALKVSREEQVQRKRLMVSKHALAARQEVEKRLGAVGSVPLLTVSPRSRLLQNKADDLPEPVDEEERQSEDDDVELSLGDLADRKAAPAKMQTEATQGEKETKTAAVAAKPGWDDAKLDLAALKINQEEQARRKALLVSRHAKQAQKELARKGNNQKHSLKALAALASEDERRSKDLAAKKQQGTAAVAGMMRQLRDKQWEKRETAAREAKVVRFLGILIGTNLRLCFSGWRELTNFNLHVLRLYFRFIQRAAVQAFASWIVLLAMGRGYRAQLRRAVGWWSQMQIAAAFHGWRDRAVLLRNATAILARVTARWGAVQLTSAWQAWLHFSVTSRKVQLLLSRVTTTWSQLQLKAAWHAWMHFAKMSRGVKLMMLKFLTRYSQEQLETVWGAWSARALLATKARTLLNRVMVRWQQMLLTGIMARWHNTAVQQKQERQTLARSRARIMLAGIIINKNQKVWVWEIWVRFAQIARKSRVLLIRVRARERRDGVTMAFGPWSEWAAWKAAERRRQVAEACQMVASAVMSAAVEEEAALIAADEQAKRSAAETKAYALEVQEIIAMVVDEDVQATAVVENAAHEVEREAWLAAEAAAVLARREAKALRKQEEEAREWQREYELGQRLREEEERRRKVAAACQVEAAVVMAAVVEEEAALIAVEAQAILQKQREAEEKTALQAKAAQFLAAQMGAYTRLCFMVWKDLAAAQRQHEAELVANAKASVRIQAHWRGFSARKHAAMLLDWWDLVVEEDAATRIQAAWRGRSERCTQMSDVAIAAVYEQKLAVVLYAQSNTEGEGLITDEEEEEEEEEEREEAEVWRGVVETEKVERQEDDKTEKKKRSRRASLDLIFDMSGYKWTSSYCLVFAGGGAPRVEIYGSFKAFASAVEEPLVFELKGAELKEEEEDKFNTRLYCLVHQQDTPIGAEVEDETSMLRIRMDDRVKIPEPCSAAAALRAAIASAIPRSKKSGRPVSAVSVALSEVSVSSSMYWDLMVQEDAAERIQAVWRGKRARLRLRGVARDAMFALGSDRPGSAMSVASSVSVSSSVHWQEFVEHHAASVIQVAWHGYHFRRHGIGEVMDRVL